MSLRALGSCRSAAPASGEIDVNENDRPTLTLDGTGTKLASGGAMTFAWTGGGDGIGTFYVSSELDTSESAAPSAGLVIGWLDRQGELVVGLLRLSEHGPDPGAVYCMTSGHSHGPAHLPTGFVASGFRRLGTCAEATTRPDCERIALAWGTDGFSP